MQTKMIATAPHWIDRNLYTNVSLETDEKQAEQVDKITANLHSWLAEEKHIKSGEQYSLAVQLYKCADSAYLYHLSVDINIFSKELVLKANMDILPEKNLLGGGPRNPIEAVATGHTPPVGPNPPAPLGSTVFVNIGDEYNLVQSKISVSLGFAQRSANLQH